MPSHVSLLLTACALALGASAALAQAPQSAAPGAAAKPESATAVSPVTVEAAAAPKVIQKQTWGFVQTYAAAAPKLDLIARWREPICVQVTNLTPEQAALVQGRIEEVARGVGLPVRKPGCRSNIQIVLTSQPQAFVDKVAKADENALGFHWRSDLNKAKAVTRPIQGWYKTATQSGKVGHDGLAFANITTASGDPVPDAQSLFGETRADETVDTPDNGSPPGCAGSLISDCTRSVFKNVLVVVDSRAVAGKDLGAVADYLAMLALSQAKGGDGCSPLPSIFDLLAKSACPGRDPPGELTSADAAYLTALYASDPQVKAAFERTEMANRMAEILIKAGAAAKANK